MMPDTGWYDSDTDWPRILFVAMIAVKSQQMRWTLVSARTTGWVVEFEQVTFRGIRDAFNLCASTTCPDFGLHAQKMYDELMGG